jgi:hypothetical protein
MGLLGSSAIRPSIARAGLIPGATRTDRSNHVVHSKLSLVRLAGLERARELRSDILLLALLQAIGSQVVLDDGQVVPVRLSVKVEVVPA